MPFSRYLIVREAVKQDVKNQFIAAAFTAFQLGAGGKLNFGDYLKKIGLSIEPVTSDKRTPGQIKSSIREKLERARKARKG